MVFFSAPCPLNRTPDLRTALLLLLISMFLLPVREAPAAEFRVNSGHDVNDLDPGNGLCVAYIIVIPPFVLPFCSLRGAIEEANALPGPDTIILPAGTFSLALTGLNEDLAATGDLDLLDPVTIRGAGPDRTFIDGLGQDRVFDIPAENREITLEDLTITGGYLPLMSSPDQQGGAGIRNYADLALRNVVIRDNHLAGTAPEDAGGGILNRASCAMHNTSIEGNSAARGGAISNPAGAVLHFSSGVLADNTAFSGGGLFNAGTATLLNTTISANTAATTGSASQGTGAGGGIFNTGTTRIRQATIADNTAQGNGRAIWNQGFINIANTIVAGMTKNSSADCYSPGVIQSGGANLESGTGCFMPGAGDLVNTDPRLGPLRNNGGPTRTHALLYTSPAIDSGRDLSPEGITRDQRGITRPDGAAYDIGAFETRIKAPPVTIAPILL